jgi:hypothetical protein
VGGSLGQTDRPRQLPQAQPLTGLAQYAEQVIDAFDGLNQVAGPFDI